MDTLYFHPIIYFLYVCFHGILSDVNIRLQIFFTFLSKTKNEELGLYLITKV